MEVPVTNTADPTTTMHTAVTTSEQQPQTNNGPGSNIQLPKQLESVKVAHVLPLVRHRWNTNEEIASILIAFTKHTDWQYHEVKVRPPSGCMLLFNRNKVRYRKDGYCWKKRKDGKTIREDHMKLKVQGLECIYGSYVHSAILPTFHRRCYWLLQNPDIVLVHYLNVPYPNNTKLSIPVMSFAMEKKEWTKQDLIDQLTPMFSSLDGKGIPAIDETILTLVQRLIEHQDKQKQEQGKCSGGDCDTSHHAQLAGSGELHIPIQPELAKCSGAAHECLQTSSIPTTNVNVSNTILQQVKDAQNRIDIAQGPLILNLGNIPNGGLMLVTGQNSGTQLSILTNNNTSQPSQQQQQQQQQQTWTSVPLTSQQLSQIASFSKTNMQTASQSSILKQQHSDQITQNQSSCCNCKPATNQRQGSSDIPIKPDNLGKASCSHDPNVESNIILQQMEMSSSPVDKVDTNLLQTLCEDQTTKPQLQTIENLDSLVGDLNLDLMGTYKTNSADSSSTQALEHMGDSFESLQASFNTLPGSDITLDHLDLLDIPELEKICTDMSGASQINSQHSQGCDSQRNNLVDMNANFPGMDLSSISASNITLDSQSLCSHGYNHGNTTLQNKHVCSTAEGQTACITTSTPVVPSVSTYHSGRGDNLMVSNKPATAEGVAVITDFSPDWAYPEGQTKVLVTGPWHTTMGTYTVLLDGKVVATTLVQPGVLRCFVPGHQPGIVMLQVACDGQLVSNTVMFEYKERQGTSKDLDGPHTDWFSVDDMKLQQQLTAKVKHLETALTQIPENTCVRQILANLASPVDRDICLMRHIESLTGCMWTINDLTIENGSMGLSLLHLAAGLGYHRFIKALIQWRSDNPSWMLEYEVDAHSSDLNSCTPLMWACARGHTDAATCLYKWNKGLLHSFNREGNLPLFVARLHGHHELADQLELLDSSCDLSHQLSSSVATSHTSVSTTTSIYGKQTALIHDQKLCSDINVVSSVRSTPDKICYSSNYPIATSTPASKDTLESDLFKSPPTRSKAVKSLGALHIDIPSKDTNAQIPSQQKREKLTRRQSDQTLKIAPNTAATNYSTSLSTAERRQKLKKRLSVDILPYENSEPVHYSPTTTYQRPIREANSEPHLSVNMEHLLCETNPMLSEGRELGSPEMLMHTEGSEKLRQGSSMTTSTATATTATPQPVRMDTDELSDGSNSFIDVEKLSSDDEEDLRSKLTNTVGDGENPNSQMVHLAKQIIAAMPERIKSSPSRCDEALPDEVERERSNSYSSLQSASPHASSYGEALSSYGEDSGISTPMRDSLAFDEYRYSDVYSDLGTPASSLSPDSTCLHSPYSPYNFHLDSPPPTAAEFVEYFNAPATFMEKDFSQLTLSDLEQRKLYEAAKVIQSAYRQYKDKQCKQQAKEIEAAILIQSYYRRYKQYAYYKKMTQAAVLIQSQFRSYYAQKRFKKSRDAAVVIQNQYRSYKEHERLKKGGNKTVIQRYRSHYQRKPAGAGKGSRVVQIVPDGGEGSQAETTSTAIDDCPHDTNSETTTSHVSKNKEKQTHPIDPDHGQPD